MAEITERLVADYEQQIEDLTNRVNNLAADLLESRARIREVIKERDLAIAHDRQPYPTAWAYERTCEVLHKREAELAEAREHLVEVERQRAQALHDLAMSNAELEAIRDDRDELRAHVGYVKRYRLAWESARQRAGNHLAALVDSDEERDALRAELRERAS